MNPPAIIKVTGHATAGQTTDLRYLDEITPRHPRPRHRIIVVVVRWRR